MGPSRFNFADISHLLEMNDALLSVTDASSLTQALIPLQADPLLRKQRGMRARAVLEANRGALAKQFTAIRQVLEKDLNVLNIDN